jgi:capsular exopolysaccharide synthesis family protein
LELTTDIPVLGHIPQASIRKRQHLVDYLAQNPTSPLTEAARNLRTSLVLGCEVPPKVILCTSSVPNEGKTTTAIALAHNLASLGRMVLLIEADIRRPTFQAYFAQNPQGGLVRALSQEVPFPDLIQRDSRTGADILLGDRCNISAADLLSATPFGTLLDRLKTEYDHIVIDSPPVLAVPDARVLGQSADAILLTVAPALTSREQMHQAMREFSSVNLMVRGLVLSDVGASPRLIKGRSYGAYAQYYAA